MMNRSVDACKKEVGGEKLTFNLTTLLTPSFLQYLH